MTTTYYCKKCKRWRGSNKECPECGEETLKREVPKARGNYYYLDGVDKPLPRVNFIIDEVLYKAGLEYWKRKVSVEKALETLDFDKAMAGIYEARDKAGKEGTDAHKIIENKLTGGEVREEIFEEDPKLKAFKKFCKDHSFKPVTIEKTIHTNDWAGTPDATVDVNGERWLLDWKTGKGIHPSNHLQLSAYEHGIDEDIDRKFLIHLKDEKYDMIEGENVYPVFQSILNVFKWRQEQ